MTGPDPAAEGKKRAALEAAAMVRSGQVVGLGTGSTAAHAIRELGRRIREEALSIVGIPTSNMAAGLARAEGIPIRTLDDIERIDIAIDGADEVDPLCDLIKGGGAAHTREKVIASAAERFVVVVDESKLVRRLGEKSDVPVEVIPMAVSIVMRRLRELGGEPALRMGIRKDGPVITDEGNMVLDVRFQRIEDPASIERRINSIPGVLENGLFIGMADLVLVGGATGASVRRMEPPARDG
ncbi:MAG: ribose-5-phosphate isomerase RpiA [Candidatus Eisenbacteria bacterium]|nr:ribose-5-phosphate isomerase RpiA [Candidatus Eisenbacteria bacterium]